jgi:hypothetical protein
MAVTIKAIDKNEIIVRICWPRMCLSMACCCFFTISDLNLVFAVRPEAEESLGNQCHAGIRLHRLDECRVAFVPQVHWHCTTSEAEHEDAERLLSLGLPLAELECLADHLLLVGQLQGLVHNRSALTPAALTDFGACRDGLVQIRGNTLSVIWVGNFFGALNGRLHAGDLAANDCALRILHISREDETSSAAFFQHNIYIIAVLSWFATE